MVSFFIPIVQCFWINRSQIRFPFRHLKFSTIRTSIAIFSAIDRGLPTMSLFTFPPIFLWYPGGNLINRSCIFFLIPLCCKVRMCCRQIIISFQYFSSPTVRTFTPPDPSLYSCRILMTFWTFPPICANSPTQNFVRKAPVFLIVPFSGKGRIPARQIIITNQQFLVRTHRTSISSIP